ncbi:MAG: hypothetical protein U0168_22460 [Nannocystaceae bacterium]
MSGCAAGRRAQARKDKVVAADFRAVRRRRARRWRQRWRGQKGGDDGARGGGTTAGAGDGGGNGDGAGGDDGAAGGGGREDGAHGDDGGGNGDGGNGDGGNGDGGNGGGGGNGDGGNGGGGNGGGGGGNGGGGGGDGGGGSPPKDPCDGVTCEWGQTCGRDGACHAACPPSMATCKTSESANASYTCCAKQCGPTGGCADDPPKNPTCPAAQVACGHVCCPVLHACVNALTGQCQVDF